MMRFGIFVALVACLLLVGGAALAQDQNAAQTQMTASQTVTGSVVSSSENQIVITRTDGTQMTLSFDASSNRPMDLSAGDQVQIRYTPQGTNQYHVDSVTLTSPGTMKSGAPAAGMEQNGGQQATESNQYGENLPRTASPIATVALIGLASLGIGFVLRRRARGANQ